MLHDLTICQLSQTKLFSLSELGPAYLSLFTTAVKLILSKAQIFAMPRLLLSWAILYNQALLIHPPGSIAFDSLLIRSIIFARSIPLHLLIICSHASFQNYERHFISWNYLVIYYSFVYEFLELCLINKTIDYMRFRRGGWDTWF